MSYEPLHHKYRPKSFAELVGQEAIASTLTNAIRSAKIAPAYLFTGPRGTGKTSSARILAKSLNCLKNDNPTPEPCGICDTCQGITKGYSLDVIEIDAASNTGVDNIRELIEKAQFAPVQCRYKVYVIDECHMLSTAAFNALLKTLEEPPKHVVFVLATTDPQRVLPTIISRCQRFDFRRIQLESMVKHLTNIAEKENINISLDAVTLVAQLSQGGLRDAESLLDQLALISELVTPDKVWDLVGSVGEKDLLILLEAIAQDNAEILLDLTRKILDRGREPLIILQNLASFYRDLLIARTAPSRQDLVTCTQQTWSALVDAAQKFDVTTILLGQQHLRTAEVQLKNTTQPRLWLEVTLLGLLPSAIQPQVNPQVNNIAPRVNTPPTSTNGYANPSYPPLTTNSHPAAQPVNQNPNYQNGANSHPAAQPVNQNPNYQNGANSHPPHPAAQPVNQNPNYQNGANSHPPQPAAQAVNQNPNPAASYQPAQPQETAVSGQNDLAQVWQQVCANVQVYSTQKLLTQMCQLIEFNGVVARVAIKPAWYEKYKSNLPPMIAVGFQRVFQREIQVHLEKLGSPTSYSNIRNTPPPDSTRVPQQPPQNYQPAAPAANPQPPQNYQPAAPASNPQPKPTPAPQTPVNNTRSVVNNPHPVQTSAVNHTPTGIWENDEVSQAAATLAQFFSGEVIRLDNALDLSNATSTEEMEIYEDYEY
ncbi:MAG TPA: DNA polymerase III subunit gamma/tau [Nostocaceae cyanobacterium]|nr:DNA polymerase III subunit gamma/tau [Nostocaceae cyanobacterium]